MVVTQRTAKKKFTQAEPRRTLRSIEQGRTDITNIKKYARDLVNSQPTANVDVNALYNSNVSSIPNQYKTTFFQTIQQQNQNIQQQQKKTITSLQNLVETAQKNINKAMEMRPSADKSARLRFHLEERQKYSDILNDLKSGQRYNANLNEIKRSVGTQAQQKASGVFQSATEKSNRKKREQYDKAYSDYITQGKIAGKTQSEVRKDLNNLLNKYNVNYSGDLNKLVKKTVEETQRFNLTKQTIEKQEQAKFSKEVERIGKKKLTALTKKYVEFLPTVYDSNIDISSANAKDYLKRALSKSSFTKLKEFKKLSKEIQEDLGIYYLYSKTIKDAKKELSQSSGKISYNVLGNTFSLGNDNRLEWMDKEIKKEINKNTYFSKSANDVINIVNLSLNRYKLTPTDTQNLKNIVKISSKDIISSISKGNTKKIDSIIKSYEKYDKSKNVLTDIYKKAQIKAYKNEIKKLNIVGINSLISPLLGARKTVKDLTRNLFLISAIKVLNDKPKTFSELKTYGDELNDFFGFRAGGKQLKKEGLNPKKIGNRLFNELVSDGKFVLKILEYLLIKIPIKAGTVLGTRQSLIVLDYIDTVKGLFDKNVKVKDVYMKRIKAQDKKIKKNVTRNIKNLNKVWKNKQLYFLAILYGLDNLRIGIRKEISQRPNEAIGYALSFVVDDIALGVASKYFKGAKYLKFKRYVDAIDDPQLKKVTIDLYEATMRVSKKLGNVKLNKLDDALDVVTAGNKKLKKVLRKVLVNTDSIVYGSMVEYQAKLQYLKKYYKTNNVKDAVAKFNKLHKNNKIIVEFLQPPKDVDLLLDEKAIKKFLKAYQNEYAYVSKFIRQWKDASKLGKDTLIKTAKRNKKFVFSILPQKKIEELIYLVNTKRYGLEGSFKIYFLQQLFDSGISPKFIKGFDVTGTKLALKGSDFAIDIHKSKDVKLTRKIFGIFNKKEPIPLEIRSSKTDDLLTMIKKNYKLRKVLEVKKADAYIKYAKKINSKYKLGLSQKQINLFGKRLENSLSGFLEEIVKVKTKVSYDPLTNAPKSAVNKKILKATLKELNKINAFNKRKVLFLNGKIVLSGKGKKAIATNDAFFYDQFNFMVEDLIKLTKRIDKLERKTVLPIEELLSKKKFALYFSSGSQTNLRKIEDKFNELIKKGKLTDDEIKKLKGFFKEYEKQLNKIYSDLRISKFDIKVKDNKQIIAYDKLDKFFLNDNVVERNLAIVKGFKTRPIQRTKDGIRFISPKEQFLRRGAGAISTMNEPRRAKDINKLQKDLEFLYEVRKFKKKGGKWVDVSKTNNKIIKKLKELEKKLSNKFYDPKFRLQTAISTRGSSEEFISLTSDLSKKNNANLNKLKKVKKTLTNAQQKQLIKENERALLEYKKLLKKALDKAKKSNQIVVLNKTALLKLRNKVSELKKITRSTSLSKSSKSLNLSVLGSLSKSITKSLSKSSSSSKSVSISVSSISKSVSTSSSKSTSASASASKSVSKSASASKSGSKSVSKSISKSISKAPVIRKIPLTWNNEDKIKRMKENFLVNGRYKSKGKIRIAIRKTTLNRALKYMIRLIDNTVMRSFDIIIIGKTKLKDIKRPSMNKFRLKKSKGSKVLRYVEKEKYAIDTIGEKKGLRDEKIKRRVGKTKRTSLRRSNKKQRKKRAKRTRNERPNKKAKKRKTRTKRTKIKRKTSKKRK